MKRLAFAMLVCLVSVSAQASTKYLACSGTDESAVGASINVTLADSSDEAEVQFSMAGAQCKADNSCATDVYKKTVLPSVIRLTRVTFGDISDDNVIDIDRSNLNFTMQLKLQLFDKVERKNISGTCTLKVDDTKKLL